MLEDLSNNDVKVIEVEYEITNEVLAAKIDKLGAQMDWLCENLASLFTFAQQLGSNGGGIRGLMSLMKQGGPALKQMEESRNES
jgi:anti-sigma regulatory factor (Ser/Thr protein kinase)